MKNPIKAISDFCNRVKTRAEHSKQNRITMHTLQELAVVHETLNKFRNAGLLYVDFKHNNVTISQDLASQFLFNDADWQKFLNQIHMWAVFQLSVSEYTRMFRECQADAEAKAYKENPDITEGERRLARMQAVSKFDAEHGGKHMNVPDMNFYVLSSQDNTPIIVAKRINGRFESAAVSNKT